MRFIVVCAAALFSLQQPPALEARFIGNMAFAISDGSFTLMTDFPYQSGYSVYMTYPASEIRSSTATTLSLITHRHGDHWEPALFAKTNWKVAGPPDVTKGLAADRVLPLSERTPVGPLQIERLETPHANIGHYSYIVTWHGKRLYFTGDTETIDRLIAARDLDVAFVSPWNYRSAIGRNRRIDAKRIVIYHHQAFEEIPECRADHRCQVPRQGETVTIH